MLFFKQGHSFYFRAAYLPFLLFETIKTMLIRLWHQTPADFQVSPALYAPLLGLHGNEQYSDFKSLFLNNIGLANLLWQKIEQKRLDFMWHMPIFQCSWINHSVIWDFYLDFSFWIVMHNINFFWIFNFKLLQTC